MNIGQGKEFTESFLKSSSLKLTVQNKHFTVAEMSQTSSAGLFNKHMWSCFLMTFVGDGTYLIRPFYGVLSFSSWRKLSSWGQKHQSPSYVCQRVLTEKLIKAICDTASWTTNKSNSKTEMKWIWEYVGGFRDHNEYAVIALTHIVIINREEKQFKGTTQNENSHHLCNTM